MADTINFVVNSEIGSATRAFATVAQKVVDAGGSMKDFGKAVAVAAENIEKAARESKKAGSAFEDAGEAAFQSWRKAQVAFESGAKAGNKLNETSKLTDFYTSKAGKAIAEQDRAMKAGAASAGGLQAMLKSLLGPMGLIASTAAAAGAGLSTMLAMRDKAAESSKANVGGIQAALQAAGGDAAKFESIKGRAAAFAEQHGVKYERALQIISQAEKSGIGSDAELLIKGERNVGLDSMRAADVSEKMREAFGPSMTGKRFLNSAAQVSMSLGGSLGEIIDSAETLGTEAAGVGASPEELLSAIGVMRQKTSGKRGVAAIRALAGGLRSAEITRVLSPDQAAALEQSGGSVHYDPTTGTYTTKETADFGGRGLLGGAAAFQQTDPAAYAKFLSANPDVAALVGAGGDIQRARGVIGEAGRRGDALDRMTRPATNDSTFLAGIGADQADAVLEAEKRRGAEKGLNAERAAKLREAVLAGGAAGDASIGETAAAMLATMFEKALSPLKFIGIDMNAAVNHMGIVAQNSAAAAGAQSLSSIDTRGVGNQSGDGLQ